MSIKSASATATATLVSSPCTLLGVYWRAAGTAGTIVLDDGGRFDRASAPAFEDFDSALSSETLGNRSFLFSRRGNSWHGVREVACPEGQMRKIFIVVLNRADPLGRFKARVRRAQFERF